MAPCRVVPADREMTHLAHRPSPQVLSRARHSHERDCYIVAVTLIVAAGVMGHQLPQTEPKPRSGRWLHAGPRMSSLERRAVYPRMVGRNSRALAMNSRAIGMAVSLLLV
jgi:hypothetical protein